MRSKAFMLALFLSWTYWQTNIVPGLTFSVSASPDLVTWSTYTNCSAASMDATASFTQEIDVFNEQQTFTILLDDTDVAGFFTCEAHIQ
jgi:hypothetical protein